MIIVIIIIIIITIIIIIIKTITTITIFYNRGRATLGEESHGSTSSHRSPRSDSQRSNKTSEHLGPR